MLFYTEDLEQPSSTEQQAAHALYIGDTDRWPGPGEWEIEDTFGGLIDRVHELRNPPNPTPPHDIYVAHSRPGATALEALFSAVSCRPQGCESTRGAPRGS